MNKISLRLVCILLLICMTIGFTGCFYDKTSCDQVCDIAAEFSQALLDCDRSKLLELSTDKYNAYSTRDWLRRLNFENEFEGDKLEVIEYIQSTMAVEISRGTVDASSKDGIGEIDTYFTMVDYESVCNDADNKSSIGLLMRMLRAEDKEKRIRITMTFSYEDGEWKVSNLWDIYKALYGFLNLDISFPNPVRNAVEGGQWFFTATPTEEGEMANYVNTSVIDLDLELDPQVPNVDCSGVYYTVTYQGEVIYISDPGTLTGVYGEEQEPDYTRDDCLKTGQYTISFYDANDHLLYEDTAMVVWTGES